MRSLYDNIVHGSQAGVGISTAANGATPSVTTTGAAFDTLGYNTAELNVFLGPLAIAASTTTGSAVLTECATSGGTYTPAVANDGNTIQVALSSNSTAAGKQGQARIEGLGLNRKRFLKVQYTIVVLTGNQTVTGYAEINAGRPFNAPTQSGSADI